ncbi:hypothetical protein NC652_004218 [Populus alba x Populus x berolinensis]|nr:hypothetical protein NC652_004218 [Populus alba x Populus x berolinensis]
MGSFLAEDLQCVLADSSLSKDDPVSGLYLSVEGAQVGDIGNFSGLTSSTANSAKVPRLYAEKVTTPCSAMEMLWFTFDGKSLCSYTMQLCSAKLLMLDDAYMHRLWDVSCCWFVRIAGVDEWLLFGPQWSSLVLCSWLLDFMLAFASLVAAIYRLFAELLKAAAGFTTLSLQLE